MPHMFATALALRSENGRRALGLSLGSRCLLELHIIVFGFSALGCKGMAFNLESFPSSCMFSRRNRRRVWVFGCVSNCRRDQCMLFFRFREVRRTQHTCAKRLRRRGMWSVMVSRCRMTRRPGEVPTKELRMNRAAPAFNRYIPDLKPNPTPREALHP